MLIINMIKIILILIVLMFSGCINKHGVSAKYYSECDEYYDMQGYYHHKCGKDDIVTYGAIAKTFHKVKDAILQKEEEPKGNVW